jgi:hypothetical protein
MNKDTTTGTISVSRPLDFETRNMYKLQVVALDMYVEIGKDSRNAAAFEVIVVVEDVQDTPPIFTRFETIVHLHNNMSIVRPPPPSPPPPPPLPPNALARALTLMNIIYLYVHVCTRTRVSVTV